MRAVYFPFTYISEAITEAMASCFGQTVVYSPSSRNIPEDMRKWQENGLLDIRIPVTTDEDRLEAVIREYRTWADMHKGPEIGAFLKAQGDAIPFFDDTSIAQIRADIRKSGAEKVPEEKPDPLFNARLFLRMAQEFDLKNREIDNELVSFEKMEQNLMKELKGEDLPPEVTHLKSRKIPEDPGNYMTEERLRAWAALMKQDTDEESGLLITDSTAVFESLADSAPGMETVLRFDAIPIGGQTNESWVERLMACLEPLVCNPWPSADELTLVPPESSENDKTVSLTLCIVAGESRDQFLNRFTGNGLFRDEKSRPEKGHMNTLFGFIDFKA